MQCKCFLPTPIPLVLSAVHMAIKSDTDQTKSERTLWRKWGEGLTRKMRNADFKKWKRLTRKDGKVVTWKMRRTDPKVGKTWLENGKGLTFKGWKDWPVKMGKSESKNEKVCLEKVRRADLEKWGLTRKMRWNGLKNWKDQAQKNKKD